MVTRKTKKPVVQFPDANPNPVLSSGPDGIVQYVNPAALQLRLDLNADDIISILPVTHNELVSTCLKTGNPLTGKREINGHTLAWSYLPTGSSNIIYIYGHDVTGYRPQSASGSLKDILIRLYGLTPAEAKLTEQLVNGKTLHQASGESGITVSTARSQLRAIFRKTGVTRQSELIRRILIDPAAQITK